MTFPLHTLPKWLLLPPAAALLLVLGPLSMQEAPANNAGLWPIVVAVAAVLLGVVCLRVARWRRRTAAPAPAAAASTGRALATLRQTIHLSARQAVHTIEFNGRLLLVGADRRGLVLLESGELVRPTPGEATARARSALAREAAATADDDDDGAVPKDLVIPRPPAPTHTAAAARRSAGLNHFRKLLEKAGH